MIAPQRTYVLLVRYLLLHLRRDVVGMLASGIIVPFVAIAALQQYRGVTNTVPNIATSVLVIPMLSLALLALPSIVGRMCRSGQLSALGALPIGRLPVMLALLTVFLGGAVLVTILTAFAAAVFLRAHLFVTAPVYVIVLPLLFIATIAGGLAIGLLPLGRNVTWVGGIAALLLFMAFANTLPKTAPALLRGAFHLIPTVAARSSIGDLTYQSNVVAVLGDLVVLAVFAVGMCVATFALLPWRVEARELVPVAPNQITQMPPSMPLSNSQP